MGQVQGLGGGGQGLRGGARGGGHTTLLSEAPRLQRTVRLVAPREATAVAAGQPPGPPPGRQHVEQQHESGNEEVKVKEEEQTLGGQLRDQLTRVPAPG
jgi:hypothetical protein